jgi:hypothetical protein
MRYCRCCFDLQDNSAAWAAATEASGAMAVTMAAVKMSAWLNPSKEKLRRAWKHYKVLIKLGNNGCRGVVASEESMAAASSAAGSQARTFSYPPSLCSACPLPTALCNRAPDCARCA